MPLRVLLLSIFPKARAERKEKPVAQFDGDLVSQLYREQAAGVYSFMLTRVGNQAEAEDLTSTVFRKVLESWHTFRVGESATAWLFGIAHHTLADHFRLHMRRSKRTATIEQEDLERVEDDQEGPEESLMRQEETRIVQEAIRRLPETQQEVLTLKFTAQLAYPEIAKILGKNEPAVRMLVHRSLENLRKELGAQTNGK